MCDDPATALRVSADYLAQCTKCGAPHEYVMQQNGKMSWATNHPYAPRAPWALVQVLRGAAASLRSSQGSVDEDGAGGAGDHGGGGAADAERGAGGSGDDRELVVP